MTLPPWPGPFGDVHRAITTDAGPPPVPSRGTRRPRVPLAERERLFPAMLTGLAVLAAFVVTLGIAGDPASPNRTIERYVDATAKHRWDAVWPLLCDDVRQAWPDRAAFTDEMIRRTEGLGPPVDTRLTIRAVRMDASTTRPTFVVDASLATATHDDDGQLTVVLDDGGFAVCGHRHLSSGP